MNLSTSAVWELVHAERQQLTADLAPVSDSRWNTPSLCPGWSVHDVLAHLVDTALTGRLAFIWSMVRAKGDFNLANNRGIARYKHEVPQQTLAAFDKARGLTRTPPAHRATRLVEAIVHGEDIRRPLRIQGNYPAAGVVEALAFQRRTPVSFGGGRERAEGLCLVDPESDISLGEGDEVSGAAIDLLLTISGRPVRPGLLTGPGVGRLTQQSKPGV